MKKSRTVKALVFVLALTLLAACSKSSVSPKDTASTPSASSSAASVTSSASETVGESDGDIYKGYSSALPSSMSNFITLDLENNTVTQRYFEDYELTLVNIWATYCSPCLKEMPVLGELAAEYADKGVGILGIVADVQNEEGIALAKEIVQQTAANYPHVLPTQELYDAKLKDVSAVPETFFVDSKGNIVSESILGAKNKKEWIKIIELYQKRLASK